MIVTAYIALGSNVGDRRANLDGAIQALREHSKVNVQAVSSYHETDADPILPHPRMARRAFVLLPLVEIAPKVVHPVLGLTIERLAEGVQPLPPAERPLAGLRTLITGSSSGIGLAIANAFADAGAWV